MKFTDWACSRCLAKHANIKAAKRKAGDRKQQKKQRDKNKAARAILKAKRGAL
jgi:hypothetical protein